MGGGLHTKRAKDSRVEKRYVIEVTQEDIDAAVKGNSSRCAVATAIARQIGDAGHVIVDVQTIRFSRLDKRARLYYLTPPVVTSYIIDFDAGDPIEPFSFRLSHPIQVSDMQNGTTTRRVNKGHDSVIEHTTSVSNSSNRPPKVAAGAGTATGRPTAEETKSATGSVSMTGGESPRSAGRRLGGRKHRSYGHRNLRINQERS